MLPFYQQVLYSIVMLIVDLIVLSPLFIFRVSGIAGYGGWGYPGPGVMFVNVLLVWLVYIGMFHVFLGGNIGKRTSKFIWENFIE